MVREKPGRKLLPFDQISKTAQRQRIKFAKEPEDYQKYLEDQKKRYWETKTRRQLQKKMNAIKQRDKAIELLGSKCKSCGETVEKTVKRCNLEFHHKYYEEYEKKKNKISMNYYDILKIAKDGKDPDTKYDLLCHTCHMIETNVSTNHEKARAAFIYLCKNRIWTLPFAFNNQIF